MISVLNADGTDAATCRECGSIMAHHRCGNCGAVEVVIRYWRRAGGARWIAEANTERVWRFGATWVGAVALVAQGVRRLAGPSTPVRFRVVAGP
jgi:hypothetical protein